MNCPNTDLRSSDGNTDIWSQWIGLPNYRYHTLQLFYLTYYPHYLGTETQMGQR